MEAIEVMRHSAAHVMAAAVCRLYDNVKLDIGPSTEDGFYYDFDMEHRLAPEDFPKIEAEIKALIEKSPQLRAAFREMQSLPGVGAITATALLAHMPELGSLQRRQAASLAGVAPHANDSGQFRGHRTMRGGRSEVRRLLFLAALAASRAKGPLRESYQRFIANGKKPIVAIGALMRKIIVILNARLRDLNAQQS